RVAVGHNATHQTDSLSLRSVDDAGGQDQVVRARDADQARQRVADADVAAADPDLDELHAHPSRFGGNPNVACTCERQAPAVRGAVDRGYHWLANSTQVWNEAGDVLLRPHTGGGSRQAGRHRRRADRLEVESGAKAASGA